MPIVAFGDDVVLFGTDTVIFGDLDPPTSPGTSPIAFYYDGIDVGALEWNAQTEEVLGGGGRAVITVQDRDFSGWEPQPHRDMKIVIRGTGWVLWRGESMTVHGDLPLARKLMRWTITGRDYNGFVREALFGAPPGGIYWRATARDQYLSIDANAVSSAHDDVAIQNWIANYRPVVGGATIETSTHVHQYATNLGDPDKEFLDYDAMTTLGSEMDKLAGLLPVNVQDWLDMDVFWHHVAIPAAYDLLDDGDEGDLDTAPAEIGPSGDAHHMGITWDVDGQAMPEQVYGQGDTTFTHNDTDADAAGSSGFYPVDPDNPNDPVAQDPSRRQAYLPMPSAWTRERAISIADSALRRGAVPTLRFSFALEGVDGWRVGQVVTLNDADLPPSLQGSHKFVIQRIATSLYPGLDTRKYQIDVGDGPVSRANSGGQRPPAPGAVPVVKKPVITYRSYWVDDNGNPDPSPIAAGETRNIIIDTANALGESHQPAGVSIDLTVVATQVDPASPDFGMIIPLEGSFDPNPAITDRDGKARSTFTAGDTEGLAYAPLASTPLPQAT